MTEKTFKTACAICGKMIESQHSYAGAIVSHMACLKKEVDKERENK